MWRYPVAQGLFQALEAQAQPRIIEVLDTGSLGFGVKSIPPAGLHGLWRLLLINFSCNMGR